MSKDFNVNNPLAFMQEMWNKMGLPFPGMVAPTLDPDEIESRIKDLKTVESWLKINLNMLQMSIQGMEMQRSTLSAMRSMGESTSSDTPKESTPPFSSTDNPFSAAAAWPWSFMQDAVAGATSSPASVAPEAEPSAHNEDTVSADKKRRSTKTQANAAKSTTRKPQSESDES